MSNFPLEHESELPLSLQRAKKKMILEHASEDVIPLHSVTASYLANLLPFQSSTKWILRGRT